MLSFNGTQKAGEKNKRNWQDERFFYATELKEFTPVGGSPESSSLFLSSSPTTY